MPKLTTVSITAVLMLVTLPTAVADEGDAALRSAIAERLPGISAADISRSPVAGLFEVRVGPNILYVSEDGRYLVRGQVIDLGNHNNITQTRLNAARAAWAASLDEKDMIIFDPEGEVRHTLTVFTDIECGYCRRFHAAMPEMNALGIRVRYLFYPVLTDQSAEKAVSVWCSRNRQEAMTRAKAGQRVVAPACGVTPIAEHISLARQLGVSGTPSMVSDRGVFIGGYLSPSELLAALKP